jgi:hypothetical protein
MESNALDRVEARLERLEATLDRLVGTLDALVPTVAMASDIADEWIADRVGGDEVERRLKALESAVLALTEPRTLDALTRLATRLPELERVTALAASFDDSVAMASDVADEWIAENVGGDSLDMRLQAGLALLVQVTEPRTLAALGNLTDALPRLEPLVRLAESFEDSVAMAADIADEWVGERLGGDAADVRLAQVVEAAVTISRPEVVHALVELAELSPRLTRGAALAANLDGFAGEVSTSLTQPAAPAGFLGLLNGLRDPEVQRGVGRALQLTRLLGRSEPLSASQ